MSKNLLLFVFSHPVPFPASEYGGMWVVRAHNAREAAALAWNFYMSEAVSIRGVRQGDFRQAVEDGKCLLLKSFPEDLPMVIDSFWT